jgi:hypothetical protein
MTSSSAPRIAKDVQDVRRDVHEVVAGDLVRLAVELDDASAGEDEVRLLPRMRVLGGDAAGLDAHGAEVERARALLEFEQRQADDASRAVHRDLARRHVPQTDDLRAWLCGAHAGEASRAAAR